MKHHADRQKETAHVQRVSQHYAIFLQPALLGAQEKGGRMGKPKKDLQIGDRIHCKNWNDLRVTALKMSAEGYGIAVVGFADMADDILTITALPEGGGNS